MTPEEIQILLLAELPDVPATTGRKPITDCTREGLAFAIDDYCQAAASLSRSAAGEPAPLNRRGRAPGASGARLGASHRIPAPPCAEPAQTPEKVSISAVPSRCPHIPQRPGRR